MTSYVKIMVLALLMHDIVRHIVYDIVRKTYDVVRKTYDVVYDVSKTYDIVVLGTVLAILTYDIVYDIVRLRTMSYTMLLQCRTSHRYYTMWRTMTKATSLLYDVAFYIRFVRTTSYSIRCDVRYSLPGAAGAGPMFDCFCLSGLILGPAGWSVSLLHRLLC